MWKYAGLVDIGANEDHNDDRAVIGTKLLSKGVISGTLETPYISVAVCDGVGGRLSGDRAAEISCEVFARKIYHEGKQMDDVIEAIESANEKVYLTKVKEHTPNALFTTIAGIYADDEHLFVCNVGDSRVYRLRYQYLMRLSKDHSLVQEMLDSGEITPEEAFHHERKNVITNCLGLDGKVNPRVVDFSDDMQERDLFMICSDGISDALKEEQIRDILVAYRNSENLNECCLKLKESAMEYGSKDNISVILIRKDVTATNGE